MLAHWKMRSLDARTHRAVRRMTVYFLTHRAVRRMTVYFLTHRAVRRMTVYFCYKISGKILKNSWFFKFNFMRIINILTNLSHFYLYIEMVWGYNDARYFVKGAWLYRALRHGRSIVKIWDIGGFNRYDNTLSMPRFKQSLKVLYVQ